MSRFTLLLWKHYRLRRYRWFLTLVEIYLPILLIYIAIIYDNTTQTLYSVTKKEIISHVDTEESLVSSSSFDYDFSSVYYAPSNDFTDYLAKTLRKKFNFLWTKGLRDENAFRNYTATYNSIGLLFVNVTYADAPEKLSYEIVVGDTIEYMNNIFYWYKNAEGSRKLYVQRLKFQAAIQLAINKAYISLRASAPVTEKTVVQKFPHLVDAHGVFYLPRIEFSEYAVYVILIVCLISSARLIYSMILEKKIGSEELMKAAGAKEWTIWSSWFVDSFLIMFIVFALITVSFKFAFKYQELAIFPYANGYLLGAFIILYGTANIAFSLFITVLCDRVCTAAWILILFAIVPLCCTTREAIMGYSVLVYLNCMLPVGALIEGFQRIQFFETHGGMNSWKAFYSNENDEGMISVSLAYVMLMLTLQIIFCLCFTVSYNSMKSNGKSRSKRSWFIFECCSKNNHGDGAKSLKILEDAFNSSVVEDMPDDREICIQVRDLYVSDGVNFPLKGVSMDIYKGEINTLVGETESGATTLTSVLTGSTRPTSESVHYNGEDILTNLTNFKRNIGLCCEKNSLFPYLTVSDHLSFYAKLKKSRVPNEINLLSKLGELEDAKNLLAEELDSFTKRKLCLAIALIGNPEILIINELCAGVGSECKQSLRNLLMDFRENRTIILTTNDVEEADTMSDHVTVFNRGSIVANGAMCFIRNAFDVGYQLKLTKVHSTIDSSQVNKLFDSTIVDAILKQEIGTELTYLLPGTETHKYSKFFQSLEKESFSLGLNSWKLSHVALADIMKSSVNPNPNVTTLPLSKTEIPFQKETGFRLSLQQIFSLLKKKSLYAIRNKSWMLIQVILFTLIALFLLRMTDRRSKTVKDTISYSLETYYTPKVLLQYPEDTEQRYFFKANLEYLLSHGVELDFSFENNLVEDLISSDMKRSEAYKNGILFACGFNASQHVLLFNPYRLDSLPKAVTAYSNVLLQYLAKNVDSNISTVFREMPDGHPRCRLYTISLQFYLYWYIALAFCTVDLLWYFYKFTNKERCVANMNVIGHVPKRLYWMVNFGFDAAFLFSVLLCRILLFRAFGDNFMFLKLDSYFYILLFLLLLFGLSGLLFVYVIGYFVRFKNPRYKWFFILNILATIAALYISKEQADSYRFGYMFSSSRLSIGFYFIRSILSLIPSVNFLTIFTILEHSWVDATCSSNTDLYDEAKVTYGVLSFASPGTPYGSYVEIAFQCFNILLFLGLLIAVEGGSFKRCFRRIVIAVDSYRLVRKEDLEKGTYLSKDKSDQKLINEDEEEKNASLSGDDLKKICGRWCWKICRYAGVYVRSNMRRKTKPWSSFIKDGSLYAIIDDTEHTIKSGECFGVVGRRRAGKSSLLESLSLLEGDVARDISKIAFCPQEDDLLDELTGREMLNFAVSVRGFRNEDVDEIVGKWIGNLGLEEQQNRRGNTYDKAEKRRLCVAMALVSEARVIFLDEPFKDLDLESKQIIRKELENCKRRGQIVILSSESLKEIEDLCESVVLLKCGKLHCIGTIPELRESYERGLTIAVKIVNNAIPNGENFVKTLRKNMKNLVYPISCTYKGENKDVLWYHVDDSGLPCSVLFNRMEEVKSSQIIVSDYAVTNTTLSEAFDCFYM